MRTFANADVRSVVHRMRVLRSPFLNLELFEATYPGQRRLWPHLLDIGGWHLAGYVDDMDAAIAYMEEQDVYGYAFEGVRYDAGTSMGWLKASVELALQRLQDEGVVELDEERKAAMVSNLLVVLCSEQATQQVVNTGSLYQ